MSDKHDAAPDGGELTAEESAALESMQNEAPEPSQEESPDPAPAAESAAEGDPPAPAAADPAAAEPDKPAAAQEKPPEGHVPHGAMHAERVRRQDAERKLAELEERVAKFEAAQPKPEPEPVPDPITEPEKYNEWVQGQSSKTAEEVRQLREQMQQQQQQQRVASAVQRSEVDFAAKTPDYYEALDYVVKSRRAEFEMWGATPEEAEQKVQQEIWSTAENAVRMGMSPAEMAYRIAGSRGYRRAETPAQNSAQDAEAAKVAALAKAQENASSLAGTGGPAAGGGMTAEDMANMSQSQIDKLSDEEIMKAMGA